MLPLESSLVAFKKSVRNQRKFQTEFYRLLTEEGKLLDSKNFRKTILANQADEADDQSITEILNSLSEIDTKNYNLEELQSRIQEDISRLNNIENILRKIETIVNHDQDSDCKLVALKELLVQKLKGQKIIVFTYFKDTAKYLNQQLSNNENWLKKMEAIYDEGSNQGQSPVIHLLTGDTPGKERGKLIQRFAPKANGQNGNSNNTIDILISTDVLSEGQNLQDAGVIINYDLHWNPVRMIQRAGRIDRLGSDYEELFIYNCFPEEGLEELLGLVKRLQERIATTDREVGLDGSVLGETISEKSLDELYRLKNANDSTDKDAILQELEEAADLASLDEMCLPLLEYIQQKTEEAVQEIPMGIHSSRKLNIPYFPEGGIFLAFKAQDKHFWHFYPRIEGSISVDPKKLIDDKGKIFHWLKCKESDFPHPDSLSPTQFNEEIFEVLEGATNNLLSLLKKKSASRQMKPTLTKQVQKVHQALIQFDIDQTDSTDKETRKKVLTVIETINLKAFERDIKSIWEQFTKSKDFNTFIEQLDDLFYESDLYYQIEEEESPNSLEKIEEEDIKLVCYQWFYPE